MLEGAVIACVALLLMVAVYMGAFLRRLVLWASAREDWALDFIITFPAIILLSMGVFFFLRWRDLRKGSARPLGPRGGLVALRDQAQKYLDVPGAIMRGLDHQGAITLLNRKGCGLLGHEEREILGKNFHDHFVPEESREELKSRFQRIMQGETELAEGYVENPVLTREGEERIIAWTTAVLVDGEGAITGTLSYGVDITEKKKAEEALRKSEERFRLIFEGAGIGLAICDHDGNIVSANPAYQRILGYTEEELKQLNFEKITHPDDLETNVSLFNKLVNGEIKHFPIEKRYIRKDGGIAWVRMNVSLFPGSTELSNFVIGLVEDISEHREAEERLNLLSSAVSQSSEGIGVIDLDGKLRFLNNAFAAMHGYTPEELIGRHLSIFHTEQQMHAVNRANERLKETGDFTGEIWHRRQDGTVFPTLMNNSLLKDESGTAIGIIGTMRDISDLKRIENALRESERRYRTTLDSLGDNVHVMNPGMQITLVNEAFRHWCEELGLHLNAVGRSLFEVFPFLPEKVREEYAEVFRTGKTILTEERTLIDDREIITETRKIPVVEGDRVTGVVTVLRDITEQKQEKGALKEERDLNSALLNTVGALVVVLDREGRIVRFNRTCEQTTGYTTGEVLGKTVWDFLLAPEEIEPVKLVFKDLRAGQFPNMHENYWMTKDGRHRMIAWSNTALTNEEGGVEYVIGTGIDVTERREAEAALKESEARYRGFVQNFHGIAFRASVRPLTFVPLFFHGAVTDITGYTGDDFVQGTMTWDRLVHPEDQSTFMRGIDDLINQPDSERACEYRILRRDGQVRWIHEYTHNACDDSGIPVYVQGTAYDITDRKRMEEEIRNHTELLEKRVEERTVRIRELEKLRNEMEKLAATGRIAAGVAHEINNPLAGIKNSFLLIKDAVPRDHTYYEYVGLIEREIERISDIVRKMYQLYLPESQETALTNIEKVLKETCTMLEQDVRKRRIHIEMDIAQDIPQIHVREGDVRQILYNLVLNAVQASAEGTDITVALRREENTVRIVVTDRGHGIPEDVLPHIFEPFFTTKEGGTQGGLGLGLAVSHSLAAAMGGWIDVETVAGDGAAFTLSLPCRETPTP